MDKKRFLTESELNYIRTQEDMLKGNINRMCTSDTVEELLDMYRYAEKRIQSIFDTCLNKFINEEGEENE